MILDEEFKGLCVLAKLYRVVDIRSLNWARYFIIIFLPERRSNLGACMLYMCAMCTFIIGC